MSLDIHLRIKGKVKKEKGSGIFIRRNGQTVEISEKEWEELHPGRKPVKYISGETETDEVFSANITHNLGTMAEKAGVYIAMWRPEEKMWRYAKDILPVLEFGLGNLRSDPTFYQQFEPDNGWGTYQTLLTVVTEYLAACRKYPDAEIGVSR